MEMKIAKCYRRYRQVLTIKKRRVLVLMLILLAFGSVVGIAKDKLLPEQKVVKAIRADMPVAIDGVLNENIWQGSGYSEFIQTDPIDGANPTEKTEVWIAFDDKNLYVAARLYDSAPDTIIRRLVRRDEFVDSDWFIFAVDPYYDRRAGYQFRVNPAGFDPLSCLDQNRADYGYPGDLDLGRDLKTLLSAPGDNVFLVKISYRWNV